MLKKSWNQISKFLFGDDIFISYARADGGIYATGLANELVKENFSCKFDLWGTESGKEMPDSLTNSLKRCSIMVLIGTEAAAQNRNVGIEVEMFEKTGRPIIPIIFEGVELSEGRYCQTGKLQTPQNNPEAVAKPVKPLTKAIWADAIAGQSISCERDETLESGDPTPAIISRIEKSSTFTRKDQRLKRASLAATALLLLLTVLGVGASVFASFKITEAATATAEAQKAQEEAKKQKALAETATKKADEQTKIANQATKLAEVEKQNAENQKKLAEEEKVKAEKASKLATEKTQLANEKTIEANQATQLADEKTKLANDKTIEANQATERAEQQTKIAEQQKKRGEKFLYASNMWQANNMYKEADFSAFNSLINDTSQVIGNSFDEFQGFEWNYLNRVTEGLVNFDKTGQDVGDQLRYSPGGDYLITGGSDERNDILVFWDSKTGAKIKTINISIQEEEEEGEDYNFDVSPDDKWLAVFSDDVLRIWNTSNWEELPINNALFSLEDTYISDISFNEKSDELKILRSTDDSDDQRDFLLSWSFLGKNVRAKNIEIPEDFDIRGFSPDGRLLVDYEIPNTQSAEQDPQTQVSLYDALSKEEQKLISHGTETIRNPWLTNYALSISRRDPGKVNRIVNMPYNLELFYNSHVRPGIFIWDLNNNTNPPKQVSGDRAVAISPNGKLLAVVSEDGLRIWDIDNEKTIRKIPLLNFWDKNPLVCEFSPDSTKLAVSGIDRQNGDQGFLTLWNVYSQENIFKFDNEMPLAISSDGTNVITWKNQPQELTLWNTKTKARVKSIAFGSTNKPKIQFSPDGKYFNISDPVGPLELWKKTGEKINLGSEDFGCSAKVAYSSDGTKLAQLCAEGDVRILNLVEQKEIKKIPRKVGFNKFDEIAFIMKDKKLVIYDNLPFSDKIIEMLDIQGDEVPHHDLGEYYSSSPDGKFLITRKPLEYGLSEWYLQNMETLELLPGMRNPLNFTSDGKIISSNERNEMLSWMTNLEIVGLDPLPEDVNIFRLQISPLERWALGIKRVETSESTFDQYLYAYWDLRNGRINHFRASQDCLHNPVFSPDEKRLMTSCNFDGTILLWDLEIGQRVLSIKAHECPEEKIYGCRIEKAFITPDNKSILTATKNDIKLWTTDF